ncbi:unnamed protein product [Brachionus calyciflorus]|uniref:Uncharacterized protein n=1 Tax=Brachionus calyciflorus TaxID=104777 RepID=A0A813S2E4_9BILA|nr:unnamed protein product [Brachionus calyciflorus]
MNRYRQVDRSGRHQVDFDLIADRRRRRQHLIDENESLSLYSEIEMYRDLKQINLNEFNIDKNLIIQSSNQTPANAGIGIDVILKVKFSSFLPAEMWTPGCHVRPIFFINGFDRPALIQNHVEHIKMKCSNGDNVYMVTVEADIPHDIHEQTKIFYFYKLETYDNDEYSFKIENLLLNENRIRFFFPLSHLVTAKNYKTIELPKYTIDEIDGLLIFDKMSPDLLRRSKANLVERVLPVDLITNETMLSEPDVFRRTLNFFKKSFKSLAQNDQEYACLFDNILGRFFDGIVDQAKQNRAHMTDTTFLSLLTIFYLSLRFRMDKNSLRMREILSLHNNNRLSYLLQLDNFFYSENDNNSLENDLKEYLETIQLEVGFNGLLVLYYLKNNREKLRENLFKLKSDNILRLKIKEPMTNLIGIVCNFANHYGCLIQNDSIIGALLLNYFQPGLKDLNELLIRNVLPFDSYIYFVGFKVINDRHDEFKRTLSNKNIPPK